MGVSLFAFCQTRFFEKSPQHPHHWAALSLLLKWMKTTSFNVKIIGLVRNPMAVMNSAHELFFTNPWERQFGWLEGYRNILTVKELVGSENYLQIRYEELVSEPKEIFRGVCHFLGIHEEEKIGSGIHSHSLYKWRSRREFTLDLDESVQQMAHFFGYTDDELYNPNAKKPTTFQRVKNQLMVWPSVHYKRMVNRFIKPVVLMFRQK